MSKVLVVCYSRSGRTRAVGAALVQRLNADFEVIGEAADRSGLMGFLRSVVDAVFSRCVPIAPPHYDAARYDLVIIGTPVWAGTMSAPVRAWLTANRRKLPLVAFFCTQHGRGDAGTFRDMAALAGKQPVARCTLPSDPKAGHERRIVDFFARRIERRLDRAANLEWAA
ncbi:flavodoxin family protein [Caballeronia grimmiae]|uniref:flavodoxin family protein n=1 Tax=Caballeronia grimmiae TaxID=1071679 RepID=UPI0038BDF489